MVGVTVLNRSKPRSVLFIHGLFTTSGFWLPYLHHFREHRLLILNIDYHSISRVTPYVGAVCQVIAGHAAGKLDAVLSHSLGCVLASELPAMLTQKRYDLCPVYCATRTGKEGFVSEIERRTGWTQSQIAAQLAEADSAIASRSRESRDDAATIYVPDSDEFFTYAPSLPYRYFRGDHFQVDEAVSEIGEAIAL